MKWSELVKIAEERGYILYKHGGNHDIYINDAGERILIGRHRSEEIRRVTFYKLKKQIGF